MKFRFILAIVATGLFIFSNVSIAAEKGQSLVLYFSHSGNTLALAERIHEQVGGDLAELKTANPYPPEYDTVVEQAKREQNDKYRPQLVTAFDNIDSYSVIFIGYPNWWGTMPMALFTFFEHYDLAGKVLVPFCTHEGSYLGRSVTDMQALAPRATILDGLAVRGKAVESRSAGNDVADWLADLNLPKN